MLSLYIHIPFCVKKCLYCAFYSAVPSDERQPDAYTDALINEITASKTDDIVTSVYFGGGTPTFLGSARIGRIMNAVKGSFQLSDDCEVTLEANPATVTDGETVRYRDIGFNRLSIGMQALDDKTLRMIGRAHNYYDFISLYTQARKDGFKNISVDIMYGLPQQCTSEVLNAIIHVAELAPEHISLYGLMLEEGTPMYEKKNEYVFPTEDEELSMYIEGSRLLESNGYVHYEISNYAKPGFEARHNSRYWTRGDYLGFGTKAHSFYNNKRFSCDFDTDMFIEKAKEGTSVFELTDFALQNVLGEEEAEQERIMLGLRMRKGVYLEGECAEKAQNYIRSKLMEYENGLFRLSDSGMYVSNTIIGDLLT